MTDDTLNAIEARAAAATEGPWAEAAGRVSAPRRYGKGLTRQRIADVGGHWTTHRDATAAFIAAARSDVPALLAEVKRLRAAVERAADICQHYTGGAGWREILALLETP